jgi:hypothetical protein
VIQGVSVIKRESHERLLHLEGGKKQQVLKLLWFFMGV